MGHVLYNYPAMLGTASEMGGYNGALRAVGSGIASEQGALAANWTGDTGMTYQGWQAQWNQALEELIQGYQMMTDAHEQNTTTMLGRDLAEGAKWA